MHYQVIQKPKSQDHQLMCNNFFASNEAYLKMRNKDYFAKSLESWNRKTR